MGRIRSLWKTRKGAEKRQGTWECRVDKENKEDGTCTPLQLPARGRGGGHVNGILKVSSPGVSKACRGAERSEHTELVEPW